MIYFVRSRQSYDQLVATSAWPPEALWVGANVLAPAELALLRAEGVSITSFVRSHDPSDLEGALETIREHHPGKAVWGYYLPAA